MQNPKLNRYATTVRELALDAEPRRIVSLVPSITEALFEVGLGERVVGVTDWCVYPARELGSMPRVGGTKNPRIEEIVRLQPDLVIANHEENRKIDVDRLCEREIPVWVTAPQSVAEGMALVDELMELGALAERVRAVVDPMRQLLTEVAQSSAGRSNPRVFCAIWKNPWMSVGAYTYMHDMITQCGGQNICADHSDCRYPQISLDEVVAYNPDVVLLPDEPYPFTDADVMQLSALPLEASSRSRIHILDGTLLSWYGPRIGRGLQVVSRLLREGGFIGG